MHDVPSWVEAALAAVIGFAGAWAALRVTVAGLKEDVAALKSLVLMVNTLQAQATAFGAELERVRENGHATRDRMQALTVALSERIARLEGAEE